LVFIAIACSGVAAYWGILHFQDSGETTNTKQPWRSPEEPVEYTVAFSELSLEEQVVALKKEEMELAEKTMKAFADNTVALQMMGDYHSRHGRGVEAMKLWKRSLDINPKQVSIYRSLGTIAMDGGDYEKAIEQYQKALEINPKAAGFHKEIGYALVELGRYEEAIEELEKELHISPEFMTAHFLLGQAYFKQQQYKKAREHYETAIQLDPEYENAFYGLVRVCTVLKEPEKAKEYKLRFTSLRDRSTKKKRAERMDGGLPIRDVAAIRDSVVRTYLDAEKLYHARGDFGRAEALLKRAIAFDPNNIKIFEMLGSLYSTTNRFPEALRQFERIIEIEPSNHLSYLNIGSISMVLKRFDDAESAYRMAINVAPQQPDGYLDLARLYLTNDKKPVEARKLALQAVRLEASGRSYFVLGWACDVNEDRNGALKAMGEAIRMEPKNAKYRQVYERIKSRN
jgi:tetratricopeptide (TPR) repeat protein